MAEKIYLGDGAYAEWEGDDLVLTTSDGHHDTNRIVLEPRVLWALDDWRAACVKRALDALDRGGKSDG
jgi:hypothetical protein